MVDGCVISFFKYQECCTLRVDYKFIVLSYRFKKGYSTCTVTIKTLN